LTLQALPFILLQGFLLGSTLIASRFSLGQFQPTTYIGLRLAVASGCHLAVYAWSRRRSWPRERGIWGHAALLGLFGTALPMTAVVTSLQYQSAGLTSMLLAAGPAVTVLMAHPTLPDERLSPRAGLGVVLALGGALMLAVRGESGLPDVSRASPLGYGLVLLGVISGSAMTVYARRFMRNYDFFDVASIRMFAAALAVVPLSAWLVGLDLHTVRPQGYLALAYAALMGTFSGMLLAFYNIKRFGATAASLPTYVIPVVATLGGVLVLGEHLTLAMGVGMAFIGGGMALLNQRNA
jgi:drug/metabolite transporter (DMT)-like permease